MIVLIFCKYWVAYLRKNINCWTNSRFKTNLTVFGIHKLAQKLINHGNNNTTRLLNYTSYTS